RVGYFAAAPGFAYAGSAMHRLTIEELPHHPLLSGLQEAQLERIAQASELLRLEAGETLFHQGDEATRFYMVQSGQLKLFRLAASGQEKVVELLTPGRTFAEAAMFMLPRMAKTELGHYDALKQDFNYFGSEFKGQPKAKISQVYANTLFRSLDVEK
ncbi:MAG: cyclic nucleotide-binding domain-containing protein, partial [Thermoplasmata archaeon]